MGSSSSRPRPPRPQQHDENAYMQMHGGYGQQQTQQQQQVSDTHASTRGAALAPPRALRGCCTQKRARALRVLRHKPSLSIPPAIHDNHDKQYYNQQQQHPQQQPTHGQFYGGYAPPPVHAPQYAANGPAAFAHHAPPPPPPLAAAGVGYYGQRPFAQPPPQQQQQAPPRPVPTHEYTQTATVKNQVNLKKPTLALAPLPGRARDLALGFTFDATAPCRVTTFLLATEHPKDGCRLETAVLSAPPRTPVYYDQRGMGLKFPPEGDAAAAEAHVISGLHAPMGHMVLAAVRKRARFERGWRGAEGRSRAVGRALS